MAQIFYVHCPRCDGKFPCHPELWQVEYALLCPFCQLSFPQEESPMIISATGERRPGSHFKGAAGDASPTAPIEPSAVPLDPSAHAESM